MKSSRTYETETVFTKKEMNNDQNIDFFQISLFKLKLKLYLPRKKWTMIETSTFFKIVSSQVSEI